MTGVLAVDGGQSGIRAGYSGSATIAEVPGVSRQEGDVVATVVAAVVHAWAELGRPRAGRVILGLTTAPTDNGEIDRLASKIATEIGADDVLLCDDTVIAHAGALAGGWGVALRAGTGVACLAVAEDGVPFVVDGHGYLLGDDGAAFWLGREGLRAVLRAMDGRGRPHWARGGCHRAVRRPRSPPRARARPGSPGARNRRVRPRRALGG